MVLAVNRQRAFYQKKVKKTKRRGLYVDNLWVFLVE
jgi:hypothetical protein